jgi:nucleoside-diphosphate-sugar epimerase
VTIVELDLDDYVAVRDCVEAVRPELEIYCAWFVQPGIYLESPQNLRSLRPSLNLFEALINAGCGRTIATGTRLEYRVGPPPFSGSDPLFGNSYYVTAKIAAGQLLDRMRLRILTITRRSRSFTQTV